MAFFETIWYLNSVGYAAVTARPQNTAVAAGVVRRQFTAPAAGSERVFVCIVAGTTANTTDATWTLTRGSKTTDGTATWQECTGLAAVNGDVTNVQTWAQLKAAGTPSQGVIIKRNNGVSFQICSVSGSLGASEPSFSDTAGTSTTDAGTTWISLGLVGSFSAGGAPHARLNNVFGTNWYNIPGSTIYVGDNHAESQGSNLSTSPGSGLGVSNAIGKILCHNHSGSYPPASSDLTTGATISTTTTFTISFTPALSFYIYGLTFKGGVGGSTSGAVYVNIANGGSASTFSWQYYDNCSFQVATTVASGAIRIGIATANVPSNIFFNNCTLSFGATTGFLFAQHVNFVWHNTGQILAGGSAVPAQLFDQSGTTSSLVTVVLEALDLSQLTGSLIATAASKWLTGSLLLKDCKLNASMTVGTLANPAMVVQLERCDNGATSYKSSRYAFEGAETTETSITRVGGAVDPTGQAQTRKIVTTANAEWMRPFEAEPYAIWNATAGANVTVTIYGTINAGSVPNNDDIWIEVEYLGSSSQPLGSTIATTKASLLASNAAVASDGSSWNGGGSGAGWSPFKLVATLSAPQPGMVGYLNVRVRAAKVSTTYYLDPKIVLS